MRTGMIAVSLILMPASCPGAAAMKGYAVAMLSSPIASAPFLLLTAVTATAAVQPRYPTSEDLRHIQSMGQPLLSPDGKQVLFTVTDSTADGAKAHLWLVSTDGSEKARQITFSPPSDKRGEHGAQWAPDGSAVYFVAKRGEQTQLFRLDLRGGEGSPYDLKVMPAVDESKEKDAIPPPGAEKKDGEQSVEKKDSAKTGEQKPAAPEPIEIDVSGYAPSADGKWLAIWARDPETPGEKKEKDAKADAVWVNNEKHRTRLYLAALKPDGSIDGALKSVAVPTDVRNAHWSESSNHLLVVTEPPNDLSDLGPAAKAFLVDAADPEHPSNLSAIPPTVGAIAFSPDESIIVFSANTPEDAPPGYDELFALPKESAGQKIVSLSSGFNGQLNGMALYFPQDGGLIAEAGVGTHLTPVRLSLNGGHAPEPIDLHASVVTGLTTNRSQTGWAWVADTGGEPEKLCYAQHLGDACAALQIPELEPAHLRTVKPELVRWQNGGFNVEGLLYMPDHAEGAKVPLVVDVHGGPFGAWEDRDDVFAAFLVGHGWAVLHPNPRGSSNYGVKFAAANKNDLGGGDYEDVMAGVDAVLARYPIDANRMALIGYSYGGEMAGFVEGKTDRFKAIVSGAPVIDQFSEYGTESGSWYDRWYFGKPWEHLDDAWKQSPLSGAAKAKTPFMLIQGQSDTTDPVGQSEEMYRALRQEGVPVELVTYPRENHGPLAIGMFGRPSPEPWHGFDARQRLVEFIEKNFGQPTAGTTQNESQSR
jgi:dipeptidyl aminopeptidase/acylaminoacyl peptidase